MTLPLITSPGLKQRRQGHPNRKTLMFYLQYKSYGSWWTGPSSRSGEFRFLLRRSICPLRVLDHGKIILEFF